MVRKYSLFLVYVLTLTYTHGTLPYISRFQHPLMYNPQPDLYYYPRYISLDNSPDPNWLTTLFPNYTQDLIPRYLALGSTAMIAYMLYSIAQEKTSKQNK